MNREDGFYKSNSPMFSLNRSGLSSRKERAGRISRGFVVRQRLAKDVGHDCVANAGACYVNQSTCRCLWRSVVRVTYRSVPTYPRLDKRFFKTMTPATSETIFEKDVIPHLIAPTLTDERIIDPTVRAERLEKKALTGLTTYSPRPVQERRRE